MKVVVGREAIKKRWTQPEGVTTVHHEIMPPEINFFGNYAYILLTTTVAQRKKMEVKLIGKASMSLFGKKLMMPGRCI